MWKIIASTLLVLASTSAFTQATETLDINLESL